MNREKNSREIQLNKLLEQSLKYFWNESNPVNGFIADKTEPDCPAGIEAIGFALTCYPVAVESGYVSRRQASERTLSSLRFLACGRNGHEPEATAYNGFFYRYLDIHKGRRARLSELTITGTAVFLAGALTAASYFNENNDIERAIRQISEELYLRVNWKWAFGEGNTFTCGWKPETGFFETSHAGFDDAFIAYILALGSPSYPIPESAYAIWQSTYKWISSYGYDYLYAGPLYYHQLPHIWFDLHGCPDPYMRNMESDYFENSSRATRVQQLYAIDNPGKFEGYGKKFWGITLSDGPGQLTITTKGLERKFYGFTARGVPSGPDDGTISLWASISSLPFAPEIVSSSIENYLLQPHLNYSDSYGFKSAYNPSYPHKSYNPAGWSSSWHYANSQGPAIALIANYRNGLIWNLNRNNIYFRKGLEKAGFEGGWLELKDKKIKPALQDIK